MNKKCPRCEQVLPVEHFRFRKDRGRYVGPCKPCTAKDLAGWRKKNPDYMRDYMKRWRADHPGDSTARVREWAKSLPGDQGAQYWRAKTAKRRARLAAAGGKHTRHDIAKALDAQGGKCWWCKADTNKKYNVDHLIPLSRGGTNGPENIVISCPTCNSARGAKMPWEFEQAPRLI